MLFECILLVGEKMCINIFEMIKKLLKIDYQMAFKKKKFIKSIVIAVCESVSKLTKYKFRGVACIICH